MKKLMTICLVMILISIKLQSQFTGNLNYRDSYIDADFEIGISDYKSPNTFFYQFVIYKIKINSIKVGNRELSESDIPFAILSKLKREMRIGSINMDLYVRNSFLKNIDTNSAVYWAELQGLDNAENSKLAVRDQGHKLYDSGAVFIKNPVINGVTYMLDIDYRKSIEQPKVDNKNNAKASNNNGEVTELGLKMPGSESSSNNSSSSSESNTTPSYMIDPNKFENYTPTDNKVVAYTQLAVGVIGLFTPSPEEQARKERERKEAAERNEIYNQTQIRLQKEKEESAKNLMSDFIAKNPPINSSNINFLVIEMMDNYLSDEYNADVSSMIPEWKVWISNLIAQNDHFSSTVFAGKTLGFYNKKFDFNVGISQPDALAILDKVGNSDPEYRHLIGINFKTVKKTISEKKKNKKSVSKEIVTFPVTNVISGSSAEIADIRINDVILKIDNNYEKDFIETVQKKKVDDLIVLTILRDKKEIIKEVKVERKLKNSFKVDAILTLANYYNTKDKGNDPEKALYYFMKAAENGSPIAMYALGEIYQKLIYGNKKVNVKFKFKKNEEFALDWYLKSIKDLKYETSYLQKKYNMGSKFEPLSFDELIMMYKKGIGCKKNSEKADDILVIKNSYLTSIATEKRDVPVF